MPWHNLRQASCKQRDVSATNLRIITKMMVTPQQTHQFLILTMEELWSFQVMMANALQGFILLILLILSTQFMLEIQILIVLILLSISLIKTWMYSMNLVYLTYGCALAGRIKLQDASVLLRTQIKSQ